MADEVFVDNKELIEMLKTRLGVTGDYQLSIRFGLGAMTVNNLPTAIAQVTGVGLSKMVREPIVQQVSPVGERRLIV
jgi:hypothetical protein